VRADRREGAHLAAVVDNEAIEGRRREPQCRSGGQLIRTRDLDPEPLARHEFVVAAEAWRIRAATSDRHTDEPGGEPGRRADATLEDLAPGEEPRAASPRLGGDGRVALAYRRRDVHRGNALVGGAHPQSQLLDEGGVGSCLGPANGAGHLGGQSSHLGLVAALDVVR
jgi:hypothetical protein